MDTFGAWIGRRAPRIEDERLLRGHGRFVDDIVLAGMLHAAFVRSPVAHGLVRAIDTDAARGMPGVCAILTYADLRPMLKAGEPREVLTRLMALRDPQYREIAHLVVETDGRKVQSVVREIRRNMP